MKKIYEVKGSVNKGFVGQISYVVCLDEEYSKLDIGLSFDKDKQRYSDEEIDEALLNKIREECRDKYPAESAADDELKDIIKGNCKTEIHLSAHLNGEFIGCIHKQLTDRHMIFCPDEISEGCIEPGQIKGVLKVTILVFNVIKDNTGYELTVRCGK